MTPPGPERKPSPAETPATVPMRTGMMLGKCRLIKPIGRGGMGEVYLAEHTLLKRQVAIKILPPHLVRDAELLARFHREAVAAARLDHPNIVHVMDVGVQGGLHYILMQYVEGRTLQALLDQLQGPLELKEAARIVAAVARGLQAAHESGIVHRDVKPANILISDRGEVKISDFGIAHDLGGQTLTAPGEAMGTPDFMSPEQADGSGVEARSDIYSLGVTLFACVTGARPFSGENHMAVLYKHLHEEPPPPKKINPRCPDALSKLVLKMMAKDPKARYATANDVARDLELFIKDQLKSVSGMKADSSVIPARGKPAGMHSTHHGEAPGKSTRHDGSAPARYSTHGSREHLPPVRPATAPAKAASAKKAQIIGIGAGFAVATIALIAWAMSSGSRPPLKTSPTSTPAGPATPTPDVTAAKRERYRTLVARARDLESGSPAEAELVYQDALSEWPEGREAQEGLARVTRKAVPEDEKAWKDLLALERGGAADETMAPKWADFCRRFPRSAHAAEALERSQRVAERAPSPPPAPTLEEDFTWLAQTAEDFDRLWRIVGPKPKLELRPHEIEIDTTGLTKVTSLATRAEDIADFVFRFQLKVESGTLNLGGRFASKLTMVFQGFPARRIDDGWSDAEFEISGDTITFCRTGASKPRVTDRKPLNSAGSIILLCEPGTKLTIRYPRVQVISRDDARPPASASPSPSGTKQPDPTVTATPEPEPPGDLMAEAEIARVFGDGKEAAARDYGALLKRLKAKVDASDGELQSILRDNFVRIDMARGLVEASLAAIAERKGRDVTLKTKDGRSHTLRIRTVDAAEVAGVSAEFGGELTLKVAHLTAETLLEFAGRQADLDAACFLLTEGDVPGAVKRLFADAKRLKPAAPAGPLVDHVVSMHLLRQLRGGAADLKAVADRLGPVSEQIGADARASLDRLRERLDSARADDVRREALALSGKSRYKEAIAKYLDWVRTGPRPEAVDDVAKDLYAAFLAEGWKKHWTEGDPSAAFSMEGRDASTVTASGREFGFEAGTNALTFNLKGLGECSGLAFEVKVKEFSGKHGFNLVFARDGDDAGLFAIFEREWRIDRRVSKEFRKLAGGRDRYTSPEGRWVELAVFTIGPHDYFFLDRTLVHRADAGIVRITSKCGFIAQDLKASIRNVRVRVAK